MGELASMRTSDARSFWTGAAPFFRGYANQDLDRYAPNRNGLRPLCIRPERSYVRNRNDAPVQCD